MPAGTFNFGLYAVGLKELNLGQLRYGRSHYDYQEGSLICVAPRQVLDVQLGVDHLPRKVGHCSFIPTLLAARR